MDATRAARHIPELTLDNRTVVWGHSQGGRALETGILGPACADVPSSGWLPSHLPATCSRS